MLTANSARLNQYYSPLLRLPAELRNKIFDLALELSANSWQHKSGLHWDRLHLSRTSRQIVAETAHYFAIHIYPVACATQYWYDDCGFPRPRHKFTPSQIRAVLYIDLDGRTFESLEQEHIEPVPHTIHTLRVFPALQKLIITEPPWYVEDIEWYTQEFRDGVRNQDLEVVHKASYKGSY